MKIADSESIKAGEQELISSIMNRLDPETLAQVATKQLSPDMMEFVQGDMVIRDGQIVYKMDFRATLDISVTFDRDGELVLSVDSGEEADHISRDPESELVEDVPDDAGNFDVTEPEGPGMDGELDEMPDDEDTLTLGDDMAEVLSRNRDFWSRKSETAVTDTDAELPESINE